MQQYQNDNFDAFLTTQLQQTQIYLPDANFSAQVLAKLPAQKNLNRLQEGLIIAIPVVIISALVFSQFPLLSIIIKAAVWLALLSASDIVQAALALSLALLMGAGYWFAKQFQWL